MAQLAVHTLAVDEARQTENVANIRRVFSLFVTEEILYSITAVSDLGS